jgi:phosphatidate cytidylyltransferase
MAPAPTMTSPEPPLSRRERRRVQAAAGPAGTPPRKAGRNLPVAIVVGLSLGALVIASLVVRKEGFLAVETVAAALGVWELAGGLHQGRVRIPLVPSVLGALVMIPAAFYAGGQGLTIVFTLTCVAVLLWRAADGTGQDVVRDVAGGVLAAAYVPLLASFAALMLAAPDGARRILVFVIVTVCSDIGGYALGVVAGRHPMAPSVSPKKSWEGLAGSAVACVVGGVLSLTLLLDGSWWAGVLLGLAAVATATVGDLSESMIKRDLGIKDMGSVLPGHGGIMDRLDSLLLVAPVAWALLAVFVPVA